MTDGKTDGVAHVLLASIHKKDTFIPCSLGNRMTTFVNFHCEVVRYEDFPTCFACLEAFMDPKYDWLSERELRGYACLKMTR